MGNDRFERGLSVRRKVLGHEYVDRAMANRSPLTTPLQELITEYCWGTVWLRDGLSRPTRSLLTVAMLIARGQLEELELHTRGAKNNGCSDEEIMEVVLHSAIYCGVPAAVSAMKVVRRVLEAERELQG